MTTTNCILDLQNVCLSFPGLANPVLHNISYTINAGDCTILLGSNGSGKSSLLKVIDRRYQATEGKVIIAGKENHNYAHRAFCQRVVTLTQNCLDSLFAPLTAIENCVLAQQRYVTSLFKLGIRHDERDFFAGYLERFNTNLPNKLTVSVSALSGGEQQALALALSVLHKPQILLLDEHTSALDPQTAARLIDITAKVMREHQITCLLSTHNLEIALNYGTRILALHNGKVLQKIECEEKQNITKKELLKLCYS